MRLAATFAVCVTLAVGVFYTTKSRPHAITVTTTAGINAFSLAFAPKAHQICSAYFNLIRLGQSNDTIYQTLYNAGGVYDRSFFDQVVQYCIAHNGQ